MSHGKSTYLTGAIEVVEALNNLPPHVQAIAKKLDSRRIGDRAWTEVETLSDTELKQLHDFYGLCESNGIHGSRGTHNDLQDLIVERQLENPRSFASQVKAIGGGIRTRSGRIH